MFLFLLPLFNGGAITVEGTLRKTGGDNLTLFAPIEVTASGRILAGGGELRLRGGGTLSGSLLTAAGSDVLISDRSYLLAGSPEIGGGGSVVATDLVLDGADVLVENLSIDRSPGFFNSGMAVSGAGTITVAGNFEWSGGDIGADVDLLVIDGGALAVRRGSTRPTTAGEITVASGGVLAVEATASGTLAAEGSLTVATGGRFEVRGDGLAISTGGTGGRAEIAGELVAFADGSVDVGRPLQVADGARVSVRRGELVLDDIQSAGDLHVTTAGRLTLDGPGITLVGGSVGGGGALRLVGVGTAGMPAVLGVEDEDEGPDPSAFAAPEALGLLQLEGSIARLDGHAQAGGGSSALYVGMLAVDGGSTLDLGGVPLYTRAVAAAGTLVGGPTLLEDGGVIPTATATAGRIDLTGLPGEEQPEVDGWTFFGRAGTPRLVTVDPGSETFLGPLDPTLDHARVELLGPGGTVIASGESPSGGGAVVLDLAGLPANGVYTVRVGTASSHPGGTGRYVLTVREPVVRTRSLEPSRRLTGEVVDRFSRDRWTFTGAAGSVVRFDLLGADSPDLRFRLTGPGGYVGFDDAVGDSGTLTLPADGGYALEAYSGGLDGGAYAFRLDRFDFVPLAVGGTHNGTLGGTGGGQLFRIDVANETPLLLDLDGLPDDRLSLYVRRGTPPTRATFDVADTGEGADRQLVVPLAGAGAWFVLVHADEVAGAGDYTLRSEGGPLVLSGASPDAGIPFGLTPVTVRGAGFLPGTTVELVGAGGGAITADSVTVDGPDRVTAVFDLTGLAEGPYDVRVTLPGEAAKTLADAFEVLPDVGGELETELILPQVVGRNTPATLYVEYANTGTSPLVAPLLVLQSSDADGSDRPLLTLDRDRLVGGVWTPAEADGFAESAQIYAQGGTPGLLLPGERKRVPVYFAGLAEPWDLTDEEVEFELRVHDVTSTDPIDWDRVAADVRPDGVDDAAWDAVVANLRAGVGETWGDYVEVLGRNAAHLGRFGSGAADVGDLWAFEVRAADGLNPVPTLAAAVDAALPTPGLPLSFSRSFGNTITDRHRVGVFGRGWTAPWQVSLRELADGTVTVGDAEDGRRRFQPDSRRSGTYFAAPNDTGTLTKERDGGGWVLEESGGSLTRFRVDGKLDHVEDVNGNRITAGYDGGGRLTSLVHSGGQSLTLAYNADGRIASLTDATGRVTAYTYDAAGEHLLSAAGPAGTVSYTYVAGQGAAREHGLASVTGPGGLTRSFSYDDRGRLVATELAGGAERVTYDYASAGVVRVTDATGTAATLHFDEGGRVVRSEDATGSYVRFGYDAAGRLASETDALGRTRTYEWCTCGTLRAVTDEAGHTLTFTLGGPNNRPTEFVDARGIATTYGYDVAGNLTGTRYADGTRETAVYDEFGNAASVTDRAGRTTRLTYNDAGQVTREEYADGTVVTYRYDARGRLVEAADPAGVTTFAYDAADRLTRVDYPTGRWVAYAYDTAGRRTRIDTSAGGVTNYRYDAAGRLAELTDGAGDRVVLYTYDTAGRLVREDKGNDTYSTYAYDPAGRVLEILHHAADGALNSFFRYGYDLAGNRVSAETVDGDWAYSYDATGQLVRAVFASVNPEIEDQDLVYEYDAAGNRVRTIANGSVEEYGTNDLNQYHTVGGTARRHDANGNLIEERGPDGTKTYRYDTRGRLVRVVTSEGVWEYEYDVLGNRVAAVENGVRTEFLVDPTGLGDVVASFGPGVESVQYAHGLGLEAAGGIGGNRYYDFDALGSTAGLSGAGGTYLNEYSYDPFGVELSGTGLSSNLFTFIGEGGVQAEDSGLHYMRARYYGSDTGRFLSADPIGLNGGDPNLYGYVRNTPSMAVDPSGLSPLALLSLGFRGLAVGSGVLSRSAAVRVGTAVGAAETAYGIYNAECNGEVVRVIAVEALGVVTFRVLGVSQIAALNRGSEAVAELQEIAFKDWHSYRAKQLPIFSCDSPSRLSPVSPYPPSDPRAGLPTGAWSVPVVRSVDPNDKHGAAGVGEAAFIRAGETIPYRINFENLGPGSDPEPQNPATAPAQRVEITDTLSPDLDWSTLAFTAFGFGDTVVDVSGDGGGRYAFETVSVTQNGKTFDVEVEVSFDPTAGEVRVVFQSVDPDTLLPPDVLTGFLPPEDGTGRGMGFVTFTVDARADLPTGTELRNVALIRFDGQTVIATNQVDPEDPAEGTSPDREALNTIDAAGPTSEVAALPAASTGAIAVAWSGSDDAGGSGVAHYDVFVSVDGGAWSLWLDDTAETAAEYTGVDGSTYAFYSVATDNVGHVEAAPATADAVTLVDRPTAVDTAGVASAGGRSAGSDAFAGRTVPWLLAHVSVTFDWAVDVDAADLLVTGVAGDDYEVAAFAYDPDTFTATWTLATPADADRLMLTLDGDDDTADGNIGVNLAGGDVSWGLDVLYGDATGDGRVTIADMLAVRNTFGSRTDQFTDVTGDGRVTTADLLAVRNAFGNRLPDPPSGGGGSSLLAGGGGLDGAFSGGAQAGSDGGDIGDGPAGSNLTGPAGGADAAGPVKGLADPPPVPAPSESAEPDDLPLPAEIAGSGSELHGDSDQSAETSIVSVQIEDSAGIASSPATAAPGASAAIREDESRLDPRPVVPPVVGRPAGAERQVTENDRRQEPLISPAPSSRSIPQTAPPPAGGKKLDGASERAVFWGLLPLVDRTPSSEIVVGKEARRPSERRDASGRPTYAAPDIEGHSVTHSSSAVSVPAVDRKRASDLVFASPDFAVDLLAGPSVALDPLLVE